MGTGLFGSTALGVRFLAVIAGLVAAIATAGIALRLGGEASALRAAIIITCMPLAAAGLGLATPDGPLLATAALGVYAVVRALHAPLRSRASLRLPCASGIAPRIALSWQYTFLLMPGR